MIKLFRFTRDIYLKCARFESVFYITFFRWVFYKKNDRNILAHNKVTIKGYRNIEINGLLEIGLNNVGFLLKSDRTFLNIRGKLTIKSNYTIGRGCRFDIGQAAFFRIGRGGYINSNCLFVIMHGITIGDNTIISWNCQFLDDDFHQIEYEGKKNKDQLISIGNNVWIGSNVKIYKGVKIPDGCIIASDSVVKNSFFEENILVSGFPAKVIKQNVSWKY